MFGIGMPEMILIMAIALIVIGPKKLPDLAKSLGKAMGEFKKATSDFTESIQADTGFKELKDTFDQANDDFKEAVSNDFENKEGIDETFPVNDTPPAKHTDLNKRKENKKSR